MPPRVLHLSTFDKAGGAARAAWNLSAALANAGCDSRMLVRDQAGVSAAVTRAQTGDARIQRRHDQASFIQRKLINPSRSEVSNTWFTLPEPGWDISGHPEVLRADILHLHWVSDFLSPASIRLLQKTGKPVVWTLHDQRPFTGGCHYTAGCRRFEKDCNPCPQLSGQATFTVTPEGLAEARRSIDPQKLAVVCPSTWMAGCARHSALFQKSRIEVIANSVDTNVFRTKTGSVREKLGWPVDAIVLLAGADTPNEIRKGFALLADALRSCLFQPEFEQAIRSGRIRLALFGDREREPLMALPLPAQRLGRIESQEDLADIYRAADLFLLPSLEDNLPTTMLESLCCGTPVLAFRAGGAMDAIRPGVNGWLADEISTRSFSTQLQEFCLNPARRALDRDAIGCSAVERYSPSEQARAHLALYDSLLASNPQTPGQQRPVILANASPEYQRAFAGLMAQAKRAQWKARWQRFGNKLRRAGKSGTVRT